MFPQSERTLWRCTQREEGPLPYAGLVLEVDSIEEIQADVERLGGLMLELMERRDGVPVRIAAVSREPAQAAVGRRAWLKGYARGSREQLKAEGISCEAQSCRAGSSSRRATSLLKKEAPAQCLDESRVTEPRAGECSLHLPELMHGSNTNASGRPRAGLPLRYIPATTRVTAVDSRP